jgi:phenylpropionate dioxygenase-like ring-hydroxylating dioxygenase large terminal subunit
VIESLPWRWYTDEEALRHERETIFARAWQYAGRVEEIGTYLAVDAGGIPIVVTRAEDGVLRAFLNVCRHRGAVLAEGCGERSTIQCPYHAWTYDLDGRLRNAPRSEREPEFDPDELTLVPASVGTWGPFLFVNPDPNAPPLEEHLGRLPEILARDLDIDALVFHSRVHFGADANWKVVSENFLECYHCPTAHPAFSADVDVHPDRYVLEAHPTFAAQFCKQKATGAPGQFHLLFPNTGLNVFPGPGNLSIGPIAPHGPGRTERFLDYFFAADATPAWIAEFLEYDDQVGREDTALVEGAQRGMSSGLIERGRLMAASEPLVAAFQSWVRERLSDGRPRA